MNQPQVNPRDHVGLAFAFADRCRRKLHVPADHFLGVCYLGLVRAAQSFDPSRGKKFSTYAYRAMYNAVQDDIRRTTRGKLNELTTHSLNPEWGPFASEAGNSHEYPPLDDVLADCNPRERYIVFNACGLGASLTEMGNVLGLTQSRISQIKKNALLKARRSWVRVAHAERMKTARSKS